MSGQVFSTCYDEEVLRVMDFETGAVVREIATPSGMNAVLIDTAALTHSQGRGSVLSRRHRSSLS